MAKNKKMIMRIILSLVIFVPVFILHLFIEINPILLLSISLVAYFIIGYDILLRCIKNIKRGNFLDENFLMTIATIGAFIIGEYLEAVAVMIFYQIGEYFQEYAVNKSRKAITSLMDIKAETATIINDGGLEAVEVEEVMEDDVLLIKAGEKIPVDGILLKGKCSLDTSALTGESIPKDVEIGEEVLSGAINISGVIEIKATKMYYDSTVAKILDMVENATGRKAKSEAFISKFARIYTPTVVFSALILGLIPPLFDSNWSDWVFRALTFLVVSCPCALVISVPLSFYCGIGGASKYGVLVKGGNYLERIKDANIFVFDKTGTLTKGIFEVVSYTSLEALELAALVEANSNHPIALSIVKKANLNYSKTFEIEEKAGYGLIAKGDDLIVVGNHKLMEEFKINYIENNGIGSIVYVAKNNQFIGSILVSDVIKEDAKETIASLNGLGCKTVMLTGDKDSNAKYVANELGINEVYSELLPQNKVEVLDEIIQAKNSRDIVAYLGDGINDAPALVLADVGVSMGNIGSDSAIESSDVVLMYDSLKDILIAKKIAKKTIRIVMQNIIFALVIKVSILLLSAIGFANMWLAIIGDVGVAVLAILNAMRCSKID